MSLSAHLSVGGGTSHRGIGWASTSCGARSAPATVVRDGKVRIRVAHTLLAHSLLVHR
ncbi:hypothetical protein M407DRAFT_108041 [Tulasnella calospora MUT 4182]|uniref:Uncharacterized protein n=1 Tax=Tulasnella calospora MUT 4182 TaxID=1051891 RepID=A0A0C3LQB4_9AGAM|nr:hypothetical protein M407DRAFT_108041 [Tulasnella calospora MUT 4182]